MQCVILAGGLGTRIRSVAPDIPKCLIEVAGHPFADLQLSWLARQEVEDVVYCIGYLGDQVRNFVGNGNRWHLNVSYVDEGEHLLGTAGALRLALDQGILAECFLVLYGDSFLSIRLSDVMAAHRASSRSALMTFFRNDGNWERSNAVFDGSRVTLYEKGYGQARDDMHFVDYGVSCLQREVIRDRVPSGHATDLASLFQELSLEGQLAGMEAHSRFYEVGSPEGVRDLELHLNLGDTPA